MAAPGPVSINYAISMYNTLDLEATNEATEDLLNYGIPGTPGVNMRIFRGSLYSVGNRIGLSEPNTSTAMRLLYAMNAATKLVHGGPHTPTVVALHYKPTKEQMIEFLENSKAKGRRVAPSAQERILIELADLRNRVKTLETRVKVLESTISTMTGLMAGGDYQ